MLVTVLFAKFWDFVDEKTGRPVKGGELIAVPSVPSSKPRDGEKGQKPLAIKMALSVFAQLPETLPARVELQTEMREYQGNATVYVTGALPIQQGQK